MFKIKDILIDVGFRKLGIDSCTVRVRLILSTTPWHSVSLAPSILAPITVVPVHVGTAYFGAPSLILVLFVFAPSALILAQTMLAPVLFPRVILILIFIVGEKTYCMLKFNESRVGSCKQQLTCRQNSVNGLIATI